MRYDHTVATKERVAELLALEVTPVCIAERLGIKKARVYQLIGNIKRDLGWQAQ